MVHHLKGAPTRTNCHHNATTEFSKTHHIITYSIEIDTYDKPEGSVRLLIGIELSNAWWEFQGWVIKKGPSLREIASIKRVHHLDPSVPSLDTISGPDAAIELFPGRDRH